MHTLGPSRFNYCWATSCSHLVKDKSLLTSSDPFPCVSLHLIAFLCLWMDSLTLRWVCRADTQSLHWDLSTWKVTLPVLNFRSFSFSNTFRCSSSVAFFSSVPSLGTLSGWVVKYSNTILAGSVTSWASVLFPPLSGWFAFRSVLYFRLNICRLGTSTVERPRRSKYFDRALSSLSDYGDNMIN